MDGTGAGLDALLHGDRSSLDGRQENMGKRGRADWVGMMVVMAGEEHDI
jgi:hypothetical protein